MWFVAAAMEPTSQEKGRRTRHRPWGGGLALGAEAPEGNFSGLHGETERVRRGQAGTLPDNEVHICHALAIQADHVMVVAPTRAS